jgi:hypothetical protein
VVGVERLTRDNALAVHDLIIGDVKHVGVAGDVALLLVVLVKLAEYLRSGLELLRGEVLVAHHQHVMLGEGMVESGAGFRVDRLGEVEADDFGAGVIGQGRDGEGHHGLIPSRSAC